MIMDKIDILRQGAEMIRVATDQIINLDEQYPGNIEYDFSGDALVQMEYLKDCVNDALRYIGPDFAFWSECRELLKQMDEKDLRESAMMAREINESLESFLLFL